MATEEIPVDSWCERCGRKHTMRGQVANCGGCGGSRFVFRSPLCESCGTLTSAELRAWEFCEVCKPMPEDQDPSAAVSGTGGSPNPEQPTAIERKAYVCPVHGETVDVVGMGRGRAPLHATDGCAAEVKVVQLIPDDQLRESRAREEKLRTMLGRLIDVALVDGYGETVRDEAEALLADGPSPSVPAEDSEQASKPGLDGRK